MKEAHGIWVMENGKSMMENFKKIWCMDMEFFMGKRKIFRGFGKIMFW